MAFPPSSAATLTDPRVFSSPKGRSGCPTGAAVSGHQGRADLRGRRYGRVHVLREHTGAANGQTFGPSDGSSSASKTAAESRAWTATDHTSQPSSKPIKENGSTAPTTLSAERTAASISPIRPTVSPPPPLCPFRGFFALDTGRNREPLCRRLREAERPGILARRANALRLRHRQVPRACVRRRPTVADAAPPIFATMDPGEPGRPRRNEGRSPGRVYVAVGRESGSTSPTGAPRHSRHAEARRQPGVGGVPVATFWPSQQSTRYTRSG